MDRKWMLPVLVLMLALLACSVQINTTDVPPAAGVTTSLPPADTSPTFTFTPPTLPAPPLPPASSGLSLEMLRNATYTITDSGSPQAVTLANGSYASSTDPSTPGYLSVSLGDLVAFGDLNNDGQQDAAAILGVNMGGTGVFTYIVAILNNAGLPLHAASVFIDDRPMINSLTIASGEILAQTIIHGADDPMCCPSLPVEQGFRLYNGNALVLTRRAGQTPDGSPRAD